MLVDFFKYQGTGNDFIVLDNRKAHYDQLSDKQVKLMCDRHFGIGADGLMMLSESETSDFEMTYYNADGKSSSLCGNGSRCIVKFAEMLGIHKDTYLFKASDGLHKAEIDRNGIVRLKMNNVNEVENHFEYFVLNTGSPHYVKPSAEVKDMDIVELGRAIRYSHRFAKEGINVNFVEELASDEIFVRTYERGVENETLSCGTGVTASALISAHNDYGFNRVEVHTPGGRLSVEYDKIDDDHYKNIWLSGPADMVYKGQISV